VLEGADGNCCLGGFTAMPPLMNVVVVVTLVQGEPLGPQAALVSGGLLVASHTQPLADQLVPKEGMPNE